ncbi:hypothetical protein CWI37_0005p0010 [Hamiltosporidium tvaerminnensis]|uniref:Uncharacterized protein n=1 Tax=Hamiltosporidium tvaerminnensis TaxID=1176355 RepID=A0A4Q9LDA1_9MICR|nr:hypothetical protein CWI37_0005p0010 [Hamiltosporidium tvaerminnensis]
MRDFPQPKKDNITEKQNINSAGDTHIFVTNNLQNVIDNISISIPLSSKFIESSEQQKYKGIWADKQYFMGSDATNRLKAIGEWRNYFRVTDFTSEVLKDIRSSSNDPNFYKFLVEHASTLSICDSKKNLTFLREIVQHNTFIRSVEDICSKYKCSLTAYYNQPSVCKNKNTSK